MSPSPQDINNNLLSSSACEKQPTTAINPTENGNPPSSVILTPTFLVPNASNNNADAYGNQNSTATAEKSPASAQTGHSQAEASPSPTDPDYSDSDDDYPESLSYEEERYAAYQTEEFKECQEAFSRLNQKLPPTLRDRFPEEICVSLVAGAKPQASQQSSQSQSSLLRPNQNTSFPYRTNPSSVPSQLNKDFQSSGCGGFSSTAGRDLEGFPVPKSLRTNCNQTCNTNPPNSFSLQTNSPFSFNTATATPTPTFMPSQPSPYAPTFQPQSFFSPATTVPPSWLSSIGLATPGLGDQQTKPPMFSNWLSPESGTSQPTPFSFYQLAPDFFRSQQPGLQQQQPQSSLNLPMPTRTDSVVPPGNLPANAPPTTSATSSVEKETTKLSLFTSFAQKLEDFASEVKKALPEVQMWADLLENLQTCDESCEAMSTSISEFKADNGEDDKSDVSDSSVPKKNRRATPSPVASTIEREIKGLSLLTAFEPKLEQFGAEVKKALPEVQMWAEILENLETCDDSCFSMMTIVSEFKANHEPKPE